MGPLRIGHIDIASAGPAASAAFYGALLGWRTDVHEEEGYTSFHDGSLSGGFPDLRRGFAPVREVLEPGDVLPYVEVDDLAATLERVEDLGGETVLEPTQAAPGVWLAIIRDPGGAKLALSHCE